MWHALAWPHSLVAKYENEYNHKRNRRYTVLTNGTCVTSKCESRGEGPCPCYIPGVPALVDMMREAGAAPVAREAAVHVRAGEVIDLSPHSVDKMLSEPTKFQLKCPHTAWTNAPCLNINPFHYVQPLGFFDSVRSELCRLGVSRVVLVAGSNFNLTTGFNKSCDYLERVGTFFARSTRRSAASASASAVRPTPTSNISRRASRPSCRPAVGTRSSLRTWARSSEWRCCA